MKDVLLVGLRQTVGERIDALALIELLLRIKALIDRLHQGGGRLGGLGAQALLRLGGQLGTILFCIPDLLLYGQEVLAPLGGQGLVPHIQANQGVLKLVLLVGDIQAVRESIDAFSLINVLNAGNRGGHLGHVPQAAFFDGQQATLLDHSFVLAELVFDGLDVERIQV